MMRRACSNRIAPGRSIYGDINCAPLKWDPSTRGLQTHQDDCGRGHERKCSLLNIRKNFTWGKFGLLLNPLGTFV